MLGVGGSPTPLGSGASSSDNFSNPADSAALDTSRQTISGLNDNQSQFFRALIALQTSAYVIDSMKELPGRKSLVLVSGGLPIFETAMSGTTFSNVSSVLRHVSDSAVRA